MFSSGNEVGTLAVWVGWVGGWKGGWGLGLRGRASRGVGGSEAGPLSTTTTSFSIGTGARQFVPPPQPERRSPVDDVDAAENQKNRPRGC